ncbi:MAG: hypothetical protein IPP91_11345 [Betaproteobacteria bacterium]|nr:hypothetical protein [Betaproteobacteria bacterium]
MTTPAYTDLDSNAPDGATSPTTYSGADLSNVRSLRDKVITGRCKGFVQTRTTGTGPDAIRPQYITWLHATLNVGFRMKSTWGGTGNYQQTSVEWEWTNDAGSSWTSMGTAQANTFDANDNITGTTNSGGVVTLVMELWTKCLRVVAGLATHIAGTGTGVHGLGDMSVQNANAVAVTGGAANGMTLGQSTAKEVDATRVRETFHDYGTIAAAGTVTLELDKYAHFAFTPDSTTSSTCTIALSGAPASGKAQVWTLEIFNGRRSADGKIIYPGAFKWTGGASVRVLDTVLELSGRNIYVMQTRDGATRMEITHIGKGG